MHSYPILPVRIELASSSEENSFPPPEQVVEGLLEAIPLSKGVFSPSNSRVKGNLSYCLAWALKFSLGWSGPPGKLQSEVSCHPPPPILLGAWSFMAFISLLGMGHCLGGWSL